MTFNSDAAKKTDLKTLLDAFNVAYTVKRFKNFSIILFLFPYRPFKPFPEGHLFLDAYYIASNIGYGSVGQILQALKNGGFAARRYGGDLKKLAAKCRAAKICKNNLAYNERYGSYFYMDALLVKGEYEINPPPDFENRGLKVLPLPKCTACLSACKSGALNGGTYVRNKCIRDFMEKNRVYGLSAAERGLIENRLLGCEDCRRRCPKNKRIAAVAVPKEVLEATKIDNIISGIENGGLGVLKKLIGSNLAGKKYILALAALAINNCGTAEQKQKINRFSKQNTVHL
jgi:ferredoxin